MSKEDVIEIEGKVLEALPNAQFKVELPCDFSTYLRQAENELYQNPSRRQGDCGDVSIRPAEGQNHLAFQINPSKRVKKLFEKEGFMTRR